MFKIRFLEVSMHPNSNYSFLIGLWNKQYFTMPNLCTWIKSPYDRQPVFPPTFFFPYSVFSSTVYYTYHRN